MNELTLIENLVAARTEWLVLNNVRMDDEMKDFASTIFSSKDYDFLLKLEAMYVCGGAEFTTRHKERLAIISGQLDYLARYNGAMIRMSLSH